MRDRRFVAEHRGGPLSKRKHRLLALWAVDCAEHVAGAWKSRKDKRPLEAMSKARAWARGEISVGEARKAAVAAHAAARQAKDPAAVAAARAAGHAAATAHAADHSLAAALYAVKAAGLLGRGKENECTWQDEQLPPSLRKLVTSARARFPALR